MTLKLTIFGMAAATAGFAFLLGGCAGYEYTLNERLLLKTHQLFADYEIPDEGLRECITQAIADQRIVRAEELEDLICTHAAITRLDGLETFSGLRRLGLDDNAITDLAPLRALPALELLQLRGNRLQALDAALCQGTAKKIAIAGNESLDCETIENLRACGTTFIDIPDHCASSTR